MSNQNEKVEAAVKEIVKMSKPFANKSDAERTKLLKHPKFQKLSKIAYGG